MLDEQDELIFEYRLGKEKKYANLIKEERLKGNSQKVSYFTKECGYIDGHIYRPSDYDGETILPLVFNFHGGGMVLAYCEQDGKYCQEIADKAGVAVVNVDYAVAPEYKYPLPILSSYSFIIQFLQDNDRYQVKSKNIVLMGHSAGGYISAALCALNDVEKQFTIAGLIVDYAVLKQDVAPSTRKAKDPDKAMSVSRMEQYYNWYFTADADTSHPLASPIYADASAFPMTLVISAEYDSLRTEEKAFAEKIKKSGVKVTYQEFENCQHGFTHDCFDEYNAEQANKAWQLMVDFIRKVFSNIYGES